MQILFSILLIVLFSVLLGTWIYALRKHWKIRKRLDCSRKPFPWYLLPVMPLSLVLQQRFPQLSKPAEPICRELRLLYPSQNPEGIYQAYMLQQITRFSAAILGVGIVTAGLLPGLSGDRKLEGALPRPPFRQGTLETRLIAEAEGESVEIALKVEPKGPDSEEAKQILSEAREKLQTEFARMGEIHRSRQLPTEYGEVMVTYENNDGMIDSSGYLHISNKYREYRMMLLQAILNYRDSQLKADLELVINTISPESLQGQIVKAIEEGKTEEKIILPESVTVNGKEKHVEFFVPGNQQLWSIVGVIAFLFPFLILRLGKEQLQEESQKRREKIHQSFPFAAEKLAVYLGAGMGLQEAWGRTALEGVDSDPLILEMRLTYQQMKNGIGIQEAILRFGNRTESTDLKKLAGILSRNIRRGDAYLLENMKNLNHEAWEQHRREVRTRLEKMQTKLLFPMLLMMGVVLILILTPAMISMM